MQTAREQEMLRAVRNCVLRAIRKGDCPKVAVAVYREFKKVVRERDELLAMLEALQE